AHNGTITMQKVRAMNKQQLIEEYEYICKRLKNDRLLSAQHSLFRPKPAITEPSAKRQRVEEPSSQSATVSATSVGVSPFTDSAADASPFLSSITADQIPVGVLFESTSMNLQEFFLDSDEEMPPGVSRVAAEPDSDDERGEALLCDRPVEDFFSSDSDSGNDDSEYSLPYSEFKDWEVVRCPPGNSNIHVYHREDRRRKDVNMLCRSLHADDVEEFWRDQDDWIVSRWTLYTKSTVHVLDLTNEKTVYMFIGSSYHIWATLLERMLRHRLTVPPSYCQHVRVGGIVVGTMADTIIRTVQADLLHATMPVSSAPMS
nr:hypothetical protein [Tanacetum cinerariifolium]